jgi:hypothetical protein
MRIESPHRLFYRRHIMENAPWKAHAEIKSGRALNAQPIFNSQVRSPSDFLSEGLQRKLKPVKPGVYPGCWR